MVLVHVSHSPTKAGASSSTSSKGHQLFLASTFVCIGVALITCFNIITHNTWPSSGSDYDLLRGGQQGALLVTKSNHEFVKLIKDDKTSNFQVPIDPRSVNKTNAQKQTQRVYYPTRFTLTDFPVAGINLGLYGFHGQNSDATVNTGDPTSSPRPFELYDDFDISSLIRGDETWDDLIAYRRTLKRPSISFYGDKVAQKRWMNAMGIPTTRSFVLKYASELTSTGNKEDEEETITRLIPQRKNYVAKPTHRSGASGVWVVKYDQESGKNVVGYGGDYIEDKYDQSKIVARLVKDLHRPAESDESWALRHVKPGLVMEERFTNFATLDEKEGDEQAATEFKVFMIWGRTWIVNWKRGDYRRGLVYRNGTMIEGKHKHRDSIPTWVDWDRVISIAETLGAHKDLFRVDIFVGIPADSLSSLKSASKEEQLASIQYVVSETAFHPTSHYESELADEGARLWIAGYKMGNYRTCQNTQIPQAYKDKHMLSEDDATLLQLGRSISSSSSVLFRM